VKTVQEHNSQGFLYTLIIKLNQIQKNIQVNFSAMPIEKTSQFKLQEIRIIGLENDLKWERKYIRIIQGELLQ
jgi:hypothetical protein